MNSVFRLPTFFASVVAFSFLVAPSAASAESPSPLAQADQSGDSDTSEPESSGEADSTDESEDPNDEGAEDAEEPSEDTDQASAETDRSQANETDESQDSESSGDDGGDEMSPAGEGGLQSPGELEQPDDATGEDGNEESGSQTDNQQEETGRDESGEESPISGLADSQSSSSGFEPVEDIEEEMLQEITPTKVYPYLEWDGFFRVRSDAMVNLDLGTEGTSAILPPAENYKPSQNPANTDSDLLWSTNMNLRFDPTLHITESLRLHVEADLLDNVVLGSLSDRRLTGYRDAALRPDPSRTVTSANQISPRERDVFENAIRINEAYGEIRTPIVDLRAGRMDFDWGLGTYANGGDCIDCDYGDHVDRIQIGSPQLPILDLRASAAVDFPGQGLTTASPDRVDGQPYDVAQIDDARQYTFGIYRKPVTEEEKEKQQQRLKGEQKPTYNGGVLFSYRNQQGEMLRNAGGGTDGDGSGLEDAELIYRGLNMYVPDLWFQMKYNPDTETKIRVELEGTGVFGDMDNTTDQQLTTEDVNCFEESGRSDNPEQCSQIDQGGETRSTEKAFAQLGAAMESEFYFGGPVRFGLNAGYASGGDDANYGYQAENTGGSLDFYRFDPNYHVDLILFREVIGTVTNAYYANPFVQARFFETPDRRLELQFDTIVSRAANQQGTPAGDSNWLGVELDGAVRYLQTETFQVGLEGGILFPLGGLNDRRDRPRLTQPGEVGSRFSNDTPASIGWTVQSNLTWMF